MIRIEVSRISGDYGFEAKDAYGHTVRLDTSPDHGGTNFGVRPMQMLLMGLGGCTGIDVVSILNKQRQSITSFNMVIEGEREPNKEPSLWMNIQMVFELEGEIEPDKAIRACRLSMDKYCSVAATLRGSGSNIEWKVKLNNQFLAV
jgi:putative redox protein